MTLRNFLFKNSIILLSVIVCNSCHVKDDYCILKIKLDCTPAEYIDSMKTILLSDTYSDLGGGGGGLSFFGPGRVIAKDVKRSLDNCFYLQKVKKAEYAILYMEGYIGGALFTGHSRKVNFSQTKVDTIDIEVCFKSNMTMIPEHPYKSQ